MVTITIVSIIAVLCILAGLFVLSFGGAIFTIIGADIIVAAGIIWLLFATLKKRKKG